MSVYIAEVFATMFLILLGSGVVANVVLKKTGGNGGGILFITVGWALGVYLPAVIFGGISGAHMNPALTIALAISGNFDWGLVVGYIISQFIGAFIGACLVYIQYKNHFDATEDKDAKLGIFCTAPTIRDYKFNFISEVIGTFVLLFIIIGIGEVGLTNGIDTISVGALILAIGISLGGTTGYAINPARDLGPRIAHFLLPIKDKRDSDWSYAWIPVVGPIVGGSLGATLATYLFSM